MFEKCLNTPLKGTIGLNRAQQKVTCSNSAIEQKYQNDVTSVSNVSIVDLNK